jgi:hypothetical protein
LVTDLRERDGALSECPKILDMVAPTQHDEVRKVYVTCRLGKSELNRLFDLAPEGIPAASVSISTQRDSTRYSAGTLADLVDHVRNSNASGNLNAWDNLTLEAADNSGDRRIGISIDTERVEVQVSGRDATWVHGQAARLELFLKGAGGRLKREPETKKRAKELLRATLLSLPATAAVISATEIATPDDIKQPQLPLQANIAPYVAMAIMLSVYWAGWKIINRANRALLMPTVEVPHGSWWSRASSADKIALGSLGIATLSLVVAAATLGKDLMK